MNKSLSHQQKQYFDDNGFLFPVKVLSEYEVSSYRSAIDKLLKAIPKKHISAFFGLTHLNFPIFKKLATHPAILDVAEDLLGPNLLIHSTTVFSKPPGEGKYASWHQDIYYMELNKPDFITFWVAMTPSNIENGCVKAIPGTHKLNKIQHDTSSISDQNLLGSGLQIKADINYDSEVSMELMPGESSIHHGYTVHGSDPNLSTHHRIGYVVKIIPTHVSQAYPHYPVLLARGIDKYQNWTILEDAPSQSFNVSLMKHLKESKAFHERRKGLGRKHG